MKTFRVLMIGTALVAALNIVSHAQSGTDLFQKALVKERTEGDIAGAIKIYQTIVQKYSSDRKLAAKALVQMAECYLKLGDDESRKIFDRIIREYSDQKDAVVVASAHLSAAPAASGMGARRIWSGPKVDTYGTISPDGHYLSYVDWDNDATLTLRDLGTGIGRPLSQGTSQDDEAEESAISKDGRMVAYASWSRKTQRYEVRLANIEGKADPRALYDNPDIDWIAPYDWSPDGKLIVVALKRKDRTFQIGLISVAEASLRILKTADWRGAGRIFFSPDGKYIGYDLPVSDTSRERDVFVMSTDRAGEDAVVVHPSLNFMMGWSPDGKRLLFASDRATSMDLWTVPFANGKAQGPPEILQPALGWSEPMGVTQSGTLYYGVSRRTGENVQVASLDPDAGGIASPKNIGQEQFERNSQPSWSPDGKFLAYLSERDQLSNIYPHWNSFLVIRSAETGQTIREAALRFFGDGSPRVTGWSSDGDSILIRGTDSKGRQGLFRVDKNGGAVTPVDNDMPAGRVASPDGKSLYFRKTLVEEEAAFVQRDLVSGRERELYRAKNLGPLVNLSPDGRYIATGVLDSAMNTGEASFRVLLIPTGEGKPTEVMRTVRPKAGQLLPRQNFGVVGWVLDSKSFLFRDSTAAIWRVPLDGTSPKKLFGDVDLSSGALDIAINPYTQQIAYTLAERASVGKKEVWMVETIAKRVKSNK